METNVNHPQIPRLASDGMKGRSGGACRRRTGGIRGRSLCTSRGRSRCVDRRIPDTGK